MRIRQQEITIQADCAYKNLRLVPTIECMSTRNDPEFINSIHEILLELPRPLQFLDNFENQLRIQIQSSPH